MRKVVISVLVCLLALAVFWIFRPAARRSAPTPMPSPAPQAAAAPVTGKPAVVSSAVASSNLVTRSAASTNREYFRLSNTARTLAELTTVPHAILLENALVDTDAKRELSIPKHLRSAGAPGAFIVQARGLVNAAFRAALADAGGEIVSYIPNNAYLVRFAGGGAGALAGNSLVQAVLPYEPYFKLQSPLLGRAVKQQPLPDGQVLTVGLFADSADATVAQLEKLGGKILATDESPFGPVVRVQPATDWLPLVRLPGVQRVEPATHRQLANDLARVTMAISTDTVTNANWHNLSGLNVTVAVNDSGVDATHPDFGTPTRVFGDTTNSLVDTLGHGTHVAGIIAGDGSKSFSPVNVGSVARGSVTNADFRGKAPAAKLFSIGFKGHDTNVFISDRYLQQMAALTNALISNNSWDNGSTEYDLSAASYDAATRDSLPGVTGPQPVLYVFAAGNSGGGDNNGGGGSGDTVNSPGTAKNVVTVGALEQFRDITNEVVSVEGATNAIWKDGTSSSSEVASYSSRGNVGIGTEGAYGRFKPDVVAPGSFVVSTRPTMWNPAEGNNPTNYHGDYSQPDVTVMTNMMFGTGAFVPVNAVGVTVTVRPNQNSPVPFPTNFPIYFSPTTMPDATNYDFVTRNNTLSIPPGGGSTTSVTPLLGTFVFFAVGDPTNIPVNFDLVIQVATTNDNGNEFEVMSNLNETLGPWYFYDSGTSMATPAVSGALALIDDYFTNTLHTLPSPALLKAMLINGARLTTGYQEFNINTNVNYEGWGQVQVPNSVPLALGAAGGGAGNTPMYFTDQSPTNALATGDSRTYLVSVPTAEARNQMLRITLAWTDPPGNPAAGIKLVNNLDLIVTNLDSHAVYYGNHFGSGATPYSLVVDSNTVPDAINNVEGVWIPPLPLGTNYSVTVVGRNVAVNAVTLEQTNIVQDYALVISCGEGDATNGITVTPPTATVPATTPNVTYVTSFTNGVYFNQIAGANAPWLSTNTVPFGAGSGYVSNAVFYIGQTNQWHFFLVTNTTVFSNAAFVIFQSQTLSESRMGVYTGSATNSTRPEADLNLFVASAPDANAASLTNLNPAVLSNCVYNVNGDASSLSRGGTKFIVYSNATASQAYYVGVQCTDQTAAEFGFLSVFSATPFSRPENGNQVVSGLLLPMDIPDGNNQHPGVARVIALAVTPMNVGDVTVSNTITHQDYGDLIGAVTHNSTGVILNNHDNVGNGIFTNAYNDNGQAGTSGTSGPNSLRDFIGMDATGPWQLTEVDDNYGHVGTILDFVVNIRPHLKLENGMQSVRVEPHSWFYEYVDVSVGYTNLTVMATNLPPASVPPMVLALSFGGQPSLTNFLGYALLDQGTPPGNSISYGPPLAPGRYYVGVYNPDNIPHDVLLGVKLAYDASAVAHMNWASTNPVPLLDDAVTNSTIYVTNTDLIQNFYVGLRVDHPRISDLVFHLISPDHTRYLLMENRGGETTNGCGATIITTNELTASANGSSQANTNFLNIGITAGTFPITYNFYTAPDQMTVYYGTNVSAPYRIFDTGVTNNAAGGTGSPPTNTVPRTITVSFPPPGLPANSTYLTIVMNEFIATNRPDLWTYTAGGVFTNFVYLALTEDTNLTVTPIKYAPVPLVPSTNAPLFFQTNYSLAWSNSFEGGVSNRQLTAGDYFAGGWLVGSGTVNWITNGTAGSAAADGTNYIDLAGAISTNLTTVAGASYQLAFAYARNPDSIAAGVVPSVQLTVGGSNFLAVAPALTNNWTNLQWAVTSAVFTATSTSTPVAFGLQPAGTNGVLIDAVSAQLATVITNAFFSGSNLYYLPEQDMTGLNNRNPHGEWTLEVLDNRAGATNAATLLSWALNFTFANTNFTIPTITFTNGGSATNTLPGGATAWYLINVPTNADWATNSLLFATLPLNLWWSTNVPPTSTNLTDVQLLSLATNGSAVIGTNTSPAFIVPGQSYYLGVQNPNAVVATYAINVSFHYVAAAPSVITLPATNVTFTSATLEASANPNSLPTTVYFEYGTDTNYGQFSTTVLLTNNLNSWQNLGIDVTNLAPVTLYHFRAVATNAVGVSYGEDLTFFTAVSAYAYTAPGTLLTGASAQLNGFVTPNGSPAIAWFEWGTSPAYGLRTPPFLVGSNFSAAFVTNRITGLLTNTPYHYRLVVSNTVAVARGYDQVFDQANVVAWGADFFGQTTPIPSSLTNLVVAIGAGYDFSLAANSDGTVVAWGDSTLGQTNVPAGLTNAVAVSGGEKHSLALRSDRTVLVWGSGQLHQTNVPPDLTNAVAAASGGFHGLAVRDNGLVAAWGLGTSGQTNVPPGLSNVVAVAAGDLHSLALKDDGTVVAWGYNGDGETNVPAGLSGVVAIAAGNYHNLALRNNGTVVAWGYNADGETNVPGGLTNVIAIAAGSYHNLALRSDGTVVFWGDTSTGQLVGYPTNLNNVVAVAGGGFHSLALTASVGLNQTNLPPIWTNELNNATITMNEMTTLLVTNTAVDTNNASQILLYSLVNPPAWANINFANGIITLTPGELDGPGTNVVTTVVTDNGYPPLSATNSFTVIVNEVNLPPFWPPGVPASTNFSVREMDALTIVNTAGDPDVPTNTLGYAITVSPVANAPAISTNGIITWRPQSVGTFTLTTIVTDTNLYAPTNQNLTATNFITVTVLPPLTLTNGIPVTNALLAGGLAYYLVNVPTNADFATNSMAAIPAGLNLWFSTNLPPSAGAAGDALLLTNSTGGSAVISTSSAPKLVPGAAYWLVVQNTNPIPVAYGVQVDFHFVLPPPPVSISSIVYTNLAGTNGFLLTWFAPSNDLFQVQWTASLLPAAWNTFTNPPVVSYNTNFPASATSAQFNFFDDGSQSGGLGSIRFYRLLLVTNAPNTAPAFGPQAARFVTPGSALTVTNTATDSDVPAQTLTYALLSPPAGVVLNTNSGLITWTPTTAVAGTTNLITTIVTDSGVPPLSATNVFNVLVNPLPVLGAATLGTNGLTLHWTGWTNEQFQVQWATNLLPPVAWTPFPGIVTSTNGAFVFTDTNSPFLVKFYQLILLP